MPPNPIAILALARVVPASPCASCRSPDSNMARLLPETPREANKTRDAIRLLVAAEEAGGADALVGARGFLQAPGAENAASALIAIGHVRRTCDDLALGAVKAAERAVRDIVVLRCCAPGGVRDYDPRGAFIEAAEIAFDRPLSDNFLDDADRELRATLLLSYHTLRRAGAVGLV